MSSFHSLSIIVRFMRQYSSAFSTAHRQARLLQITTHGLTMANHLALRLVRANNGWLSNLIVEQLSSDSGAAQVCLEAARWWVEGDLVANVPALSVGLHAHGVVGSTLVTPPWKVTSLSLSGARLDGYVPSAASLAHLISLDVSRSNIATLAPFAELPNLAVIVCNSAKSLGTVGPAHRTNASDGGELWRALTQIDLQYCDALSDINGLASAHKLEVLNVEFCRELENIDVVRDLPKLRELRARGITIADLSCLPADSQLRYLTIGYNMQLEDVSALAHTPHLRSLDASRTRIRDIRSAAACTNLEELDISGTLVEDVTPLTATKYLRCLRASHAPVKSVAVLNELVHLEELCVNNCHAMTDLESVSTTTQLEHVEAAETSIKDIHFLSTCARLRTLKITGCGLVHSLTPLSGARELQHLDIGRTAIRCLDPLRSSTQLRHLNIGNCTAIDDLSPLAEMPSLTFLKAEGTGISDLSPLRCCTSLETLMVGNCPQLRSLAPVAGWLKRLTVIDGVGSPIQDASLLLDSCPRLRYKAFS